MPEPTTTGVAAGISIKSLIAGGMVTLEEVTVLHYRHGQQTG